MLLGFGIFLLVAGVAAFAIDRRAAHFFYDRVNRIWQKRIHRTTDWAKGGHWLTITLASLAGVWLTRTFWGPSILGSAVETVALAFLASLAVGSAILHTLKILLGRRRPRDELELGFYGFSPFAFLFERDSFPSGHALTIFCVAVVACGVWPVLSPLWIAIAIYLSMTRALLHAHFVSDVLIGAGIGIIVTREIIAAYFPTLMQGWF